MVKQHENEEHGSPGWLGALGQQGLEEVSGEVSSDAPPPRKAAFLVAGGHVRPTATVPHADPNARDRVDTLWHEEADRMALLDQDGEFPLLATYPGSFTRGWIKVRDSVRARLPSRIASVTGSRDFIAVSVDGKSLCAISVEEYEDWIVTHSFEGPRPGDQ